MSKFENFLCSEHRVPRTFWGIPISFAILTCQLLILAWISIGGWVAQKSIIVVYFGLPQLLITVLFFFNFYYLIILHFFAQITGFLLGMCYLFYIFRMGHRNWPESFDVFQLWFFTIFGIFYIFYMDLVLKYALHLKKWQNLEAEKRKIEEAENQAENEDSV